MKRFIVSSLLLFAACGVEGPQSKGTFCHSFCVADEACRGPDIENRCELNCIQALDVYQSNGCLDEGQAYLECLSSSECFEQGCAESQKLTNACLKRGFD